MDFEARMSFTTGAATMARMESYFNHTIGKHLRRSEQRASFATYAFGLLSEGERKSVEPMAARACGDPKQCRAVEEKLLRFISLSPWSDRDVRNDAAKFAIDAISEREPVTTWIIDDTGFLKQGNHSVGVQRQYTGSAGKVTNCQVAVSLSIASRTQHVPIDFELYLPESWNDDERRMKARIPDDVTFKTKPELALEMIRRAHEAAIPGDLALADSGYGHDSEFRNGIRELEMDDGVGIHGPAKVWCLDSLGRRRGDPISVQQLGIQLGAKAFRRYTWRDGTKQKLSSHFCFRRVKVANDDETEAADREPVWLMIEWPQGEERPAKFTLTTLPRQLSKKQIVRRIKERYRTEIAYEELKGELGLDHFEGRSFPGWHHHVSVVLVCYAFVVSERMRAFSPSPRWNCSTGSFALAA